MSDKGYAPPKTLKRKGHETLLQRHEEDVRELLSKGLKPKGIADSLCTMHKYPPRTITAKQVSDWIVYQKKNKRIKTPSVTGSGISADWQDSCKYFSIKHKCQTNVRR